MAGILNAELAFPQFPALDQYGQNTTLLLHGDGTNGAQNNTFLDSSTNNFTITRNGNTTQGTFSPFSQPNGWWSNYFNSSSDYLSIASNAALGFGTGDFTIECWFYPLTNTAVNTIFTNGPAAGGSIGLYILSTGVIELACYNGANLDGVTKVPANQWSHIAATRSGTTMRVFLNGNLDASSTNAFNNTSTIGTIGALWGASSNGYISNLRVVKGTALYTASFSVPTSPLTAISGTSLLACQSNRFQDNSSNAFTLTSSGSPSVQAFHPISAPTAYYPAVNGGAGYFDGSGDYLTSATSTNLQLGTSDFTVEYWVNFSSLPGYFAASVFGTGLSSSGSAAFDALFGWYQVSSSGGNLSLFLSSAASGWDIASNVVIIPAYPALNTWHHVAVTRNGSTFRTFWNGVQQATFTSSASIYQSANSITLGVGQGGWFNGYLSNYRFVKGTSLYNSNFAPPTVPLTAVANTQYLLSCTNAGIIDSVSQNQLETVGNAQVSTTQSKFGGASMYFDGDNDYLKIPSNPALGMGSGDFTIEAWIYPTTVSPTYQGIFSTTGTSSSDIQVQLNNNLLRFTSYTVQIAITTSTISANQWTHIAVCRFGGTTYLYVNGNLGGSGTDSTNWVANPANIGAIFNSSYSFSGYIDDFRVTKGIARYTQNFTPPQNAYPNYGPLTNIPTVDPNFKNTTLLLHGNGTNGAQNNTFLDSSTNNFTITRNGNTTQGTFTPFSQPNGWWSNYFPADNATYLFVASNSAFNLNTYVCLECWVNFATVGSGGSSALIVGRESSFWIAYDYNGIGGASGKFVFTILNSGSSWQAVSSTTTPVAGQWYHVVGIKDNTTLRIYINGNQENTASFSGSPANTANGISIGSLVGSQGPYKGYVSNARLVISASNVLPYTGNFTPPTTPLTAVTGTALLTCQSNRFVDNSANAFTVTSAGSPSVQNFYPFFPPLDYSTAAIGGSAYLDGSGDYLSSSVGAIGTGDFTVEFYANWTSTFGGYFQISTTSGGLSTTYTNGLLAYSNSGTLFFFIGNTPYGTTYTIIPNQWVHIAIVRSSGTVSLYVNGILSSTPTTDTTNISGTYLALGGYYSTSYLMTGYLSNFRLLIGTALYTSNFTPPTAPLTAITNTSFLLSATNGGIFDNASKNMFETVGTAQISTTQSKFGGSSIYLNGSGNYLLSSSAQAYDKFGTANFTVEYWIYLNSAANQQAAVVCGAGTVGYDPIFGWVDSSALQLYLSSAASGWDIASAVTIIPATVSTGVWYHVAVTRNGSTFRTFCNGVQQSTFTSSASIYQSAGQINIGRYATGYWINAYFDDIRITNGVSRYNSNFTPPAAPFPNK